MDTSKRISTIETIFPNLHKTGYGKTSEKTTQYNCIAWAAEDTSNWWWPVNGPNGYYWPAELPKNTEIKNFIKLYQITGGYSICDSGELEKDYEKIVIYADTNNQVTHAARQKDDGTWTSKLGKLEDIAHRIPEGVSGNAYGRVVQYMKRPRN